MLTKESVSIKTDRFITDTDDNKEYPLEPVRTAYVNSEPGRRELQEQQPNDVINAVFAMWGNEPLIKEQPNNE